MEITPLSDHTGAEVRGIDLARPVTASARDALNDAFVAHSVLVVREQSLGPHQVLTAVALFGPRLQQHTWIRDPGMSSDPLPLNQDRFPDGRRYPWRGLHTRPFQ
jgi:taurine dioxygenase